MRREQYKQLQYHIYRVEIIGTPFEVAVNAAKRKLPFVYYRDYRDETVPIVVGFVRAKQSQIASWYGEYSTYSTYAGKLCSSSEVDLEHISIYANVDPSNLFLRK